MKKLFLWKEFLLEKRIRDLKFDQINNSIILALEDFHEVMILKVKP